MAYLEPNGNIYHETFLQKIVNGFQPLTIFAKSSILDVQLGSKYASELTRLKIFFLQISE